MASKLGTTTRHRNIWFLMLTLRTPAPFLPKTTQTIRRSTPPTPRRVPSSSAHETRIAMGLCRSGAARTCKIRTASYVPEAVRWVVSGGATLHEYKGFSASLRLRYFGPRPLTSDGLYTSPPTVIVNLGATYAFNKNWSVSGEVLNVLNRRDHDVDYAYVSQITPAAGLGLPATPPTTLAGQTAVASPVNANAAFTRVMHPVEPIQLRAWLTYRF